MRALWLGLAFAALLVAPAAAQSPAAQQVAAQIAAIVQQSSASGARSSAMARDLQDPLGGRHVELKADEVARQSILSAVVGAIAARPAEAAAIVAAAVDAAPSLRNDIITAATTSYPAFAPAIRGTVGAAAPAPPTPNPQRIAPAPRSPPAVAAQAPAPPPQAPEAPPPAADAAFDDEPSGTTVLVAPFNDPLEPINRGIFAFNDVLDRFLIGPIARGYGFIVPEPGKQVVRNFFSNLRAPIRFANDVLQLDGSGAAVTGGRFLINTTVGVLGFLDVADVIGLEHHPADFGQTLHRYSVGAGPYIVIPVLGPSTVRDGVGLVADTFIDPLTYLLDPYPRIAVAAAEGIVKRETLIELLDELRASSVDFYAALRAAYFQDRAVTLAKGNAPQRSAADDAFGSFE